MTVTATVNGNSIGTCDVDVHVHDPDNGDDNVTFDVHVTDTTIVTANVTDTVNVTDNVILTTVVDVSDTDNVT